MKNFGTTLILGTALAGFAATANAQIYLHSEVASGDYGSGVTTRFNFAIDLVANKLRVEVDNTIALNSAGVGVKGTVISFGFKTPFTSAALTTSNVTTKVKWIDWNSGRSGFANEKVIDQSAGSTFWEEHEPYSIAHVAPTYDQEFGVSTKDYPSPDAGGLDNISQGVRYGEIAVFEFTFTAGDITQSNYKNFFGNDFLSVYWREVTKVSKVGGNFVESNANGGWDKGLEDFFPPTDGDLPPTPEPSTYGLMGAAALMGLVARRRHLAKKAKN